MFLARRNKLWVWELKVYAGWGVPLAPQLNTHPVNN
jgi:hypothetical protein